MGKFTKDKRVIKNIQYSNYDIYYRKAKQQCYRARSAYKLLQIDDLFHIFTSVERVVDLCGAPGSWSQVCRKKLIQNGSLNKPCQVIIIDKEQGYRIISVDLQQMSPINSVFHIIGDITKKQTLLEINNALSNEKCNLVICDGAPDITGFHDMDQYIQSQLLVAALNIAIKILFSGGKFIAKIFKGTQINFLYSQFKLYFKQIHIVKQNIFSILRPNSSRDSSAQHFLIGLHFKNNINSIQLSTFNRQINQNYENSTNNKIFKFITCGDLSGFDQKQSIQKQQQQQYLE